jgi:hypothetical protein
MRILLLSLNYSPELTGIGKYNGEMSRWLVNNDVDDVAGIERLISRWLALTSLEKTEMSGRAKVCYEANFSIESAVGDLDKVLLAVVNK